MGYLGAIIMVLALGAVAWVILVDNEYPAEYHHIKRAKGFWERS